MNYSRGPGDFRGFALQQRREWYHESSVSQRPSNICSKNDKSVCFEREGIWTNTTQTSSASCKC